jgi:hypothetical protein
MEKKVVQHAIVASIEILESGVSPGVLVVGDGALAAAGGDGFAGLTVLLADEARVEVVIVVNEAREVGVVTGLLVGRGVVIVINEAREVGVVTGLLVGRGVVACARLVAVPVPAPAMGRCGRTRKMTPVRTAAATAATTGSDRRRPPSAMNAFRGDLACRRGRTAPGTAGGSAVSWFARSAWSPGLAGMSRPCTMASTTCGLKSLEPTT